MGIDLKRNSRNNTSFFQKLHHENAVEDKQKKLLNNSDGFKCFYLFSSSKRDILQMLVCGEKTVCDWVILVTGSSFLIFLLKRSSKFFVLPIMHNKAFSRIIHFWSKVLRVFWKWNSGKILSLAAKLNQRFEPSSFRGNFISKNPIKMQRRDTQYDFGCLLCVFQIFVV